MKKVQFNSDSYYHVYNRGVDKRDIFLDKRDYQRFLYLLFTCNDTKPILNSQFYYKGFASIDKYPRERDLLVDILCFCLMPNHYHLLLKQRVDNGIPFFMQKFGTGYTMYFNTRYKRNGVLLQGVFKAKYIDKEEYLTHLSRYIHLNAAELKEPGWKEKGLTKHTFESIKRYSWSSYSDYLGKEQFSKILNREIMAELYRSPQQYEQFVKDWVTKDRNL